MQRRKIINIGRIILAGVVAVLVQACGDEVGGNEDTTKPVPVLTSLNDGEEVVGTYQITWDMLEANRSTVDIYITNSSTRQTLFDCFTGVRTCRLEI
jgi:hypothetical protein